MGDEGSITCERRILCGRGTFVKMKLANMLLSLLVSLLTLGCFSVRPLHDSLVPCVCVLFLIVTGVHVYSLWCAAIFVSIAYKAHRRERHAARARKISLNERQRLVRL